MSIIPPSGQYWSPWWSQREELRTVHLCPETLLYLWWYYRNWSVLPAFQPAQNALKLADFNGKTAMPPRSILCTSLQHLSPDATLNPQTETCGFAFKCNSTVTDQQSTLRTIWHWVLYLAFHADKIQRVINWLRVLLKWCPHIASNCCCYTCIFAVKSSICKQCSILLQQPTE